METADSNEGNQTGDGADQLSHEDLSDHSHAAVVAMLDRLSPDELDYELQLDHVLDTLDLEEEIFQHTDSQPELFRQNNDGDYCEAGASQMNVDSFLSQPQGSWNDSGCDSENSPKPIALDGRLDQRKPCKAGLKTTGLNSDEFQQPLETDAPATTEQNILQRIRSSNRYRDVFKDLDDSSLLQLIKKGLEKPRNKLRPILPRVTSSSKEDTHRASTYSPIKRKGKPRGEYRKYKESSTNTGNQPTHGYREGKSDSVWETDSRNDKHPIKRFREKFIAVSKGVQDGLSWSKSNYDTAKFPENLQADLPEEGKVLHVSMHGDRTWKDYWLQENDEAENLVEREAKRKFDDEEEGPDGVGPIAG